MHHSKIIERMNLIPFPEEGGYYKETYRSNRMIESKELGKKSECTAIYYLITPDSFSALHCVDQDEIFHFYAGSPVEMFQILPDGTANTITIGSDIMNDESPQVIVPHGVWQGTKLKDTSEESWALLGCTVAPGFEFKNFHLKSRDELLKIYPKHTDNIIKYTN